MRLLRPFAGLTLALAIAACGGGGGDAGFLTNFTLFDAVTTGDLDGDGRIDLATGNTLLDATPQRNRLTVLLQDRAQAGQFGRRTDIALAGDADSYGATTADLDADGRPDVIVSSHVGRLAGTTASGKVTVLLQSAAGGGQLQAPLTLASQAGAWGLAVADLDADGRLDVAVGHDTGVDVFMQLPGTTFAAATTLVLGERVVGVAAADFDRDGLQDLVAAGATRVWVVRQRRGGGFETAQGFDVGRAPWDLKAADFDADGYPDVAVLLYASNAGGSELVLLFGQPAAPGTLGGAQHYTGLTDPWSVAVADLDRDGRLDVVVGLGPAVQRDQVQVYLREPVAAVRLRTPLGFEAGTGLGAVAVADADGDGLLDVVGGGAKLVILPQRAGAFALGTARVIIDH